jgi:hypothetical protein
MHAMTVYKETITEGLGFHDTASLSDLSDYIKVLFDKTCEVVCNRPSLSEEERHIFEDKAKTFECSFKDILTISDKQIRETALRAAVSALTIGYYHAGSPQVLQEIEKEFQKERTKSANTARRLPDIPEIIKRELRKRKPECMNKPSITANAIWPAVMKEIKKLPKIPEG